MKKRQTGFLRRPHKIAVKREVKGKGEKERYIHLNAEFQRIAGEQKRCRRKEQTCSHSEGRGSGMT